MAEEYLTDDEQLEAVKRWTAQNGLWVAGGVVLGVLLLAGYRYYDGYRNERALKAAAQFGDMAGALEASDGNKARQIADALIKDYPGSPYADQAQLTLARLYVDDGQPAGAVPALTSVMNGSKDTELRHIARLRLARIQIDQGKPDEALQTLAADTPGAFAARYHEVRGDAFFAKKDLSGALTEYKSALGAAEAGGVDVQLLELKIADIGTPPGAAAAAVSAPAIATAPSAAAPAATAPAPAAVTAVPAAPPAAGAPAGSIPNKAKP